MTQHLHTRNEEEGSAVQKIYRANCHWLANLNYVARVCMYVHVPQVLSLLMSYWVAPVPTR